MKCYICQKECDIEENLSDSYLVKCPRCGNYSITGTAFASSLIESISDSYILSGVIRQISEKEGSLLELDSVNINKFIESASVPQNPIESIDRLLLYLLEQEVSADEFIDLSFDDDYPLIFSRNGEEFEFYLEKAQEIGLIEGTGFKGGGEYRLSLKGWERAFELKKRRPETNQAFVAMWFYKELDEAWENGFKKALKSTGFDPIRVDLVEHNEKICDKIIAEIRKSALVIADFTGNRGGVYFEAGFAMGLGIPVIWTCQIGHVNDLHFDTRQYNHIVWETNEDLYISLKNRIEATLMI